MAIYRDPKTRRWRFRADVRLPDGTVRRVSGTPGAGLHRDLANTKIAAREAERRSIHEVLTGEPFRPAPPVEKEVPTIAEYSKVFMAGYAASHKTSERRAKRQILDGHVLPAFGDLRLDEIRQHHVDAFVGAELRRCSPKTVNNRLAVLSSLIKYAVANGEISPARLRLKIKSGIRKGEKPRAVDMSDVDRLVAAAEPRLRAVILLATEAGLRVGEILGLQWGDIRDGVLTVRRAVDKDSGEIGTPKHDQVREVPVSARVVDALELLPRLGLWVICKADGDRLGYYALLEQVANLYQRAGVAKPPKPLHSLRHTFGTEVAARGVPLPVLQELMGHTDVATTRQYIHVRAEQKRDAIVNVFGVGSAKPAPNQRKPKSKNPANY